MFQYTRVNEYMSLAARPHSLLVLDLDIAAADRLVKAIVVDDNLIAPRDLVPNPDPEGVVAARIEIFGPEHELVALAWPRVAVDGAGPLVLGVGAALVDHQPVVVIRVEVQAAGGEVEFGVTRGHRLAFLVLGDEAEVCLANRT